MVEGFAFRDDFSHGGQSAFHGADGVGDFLAVQGLHPKDSLEGAVAVEVLLERDVENEARRFDAVIDRLVTQVGQPCRRAKTELRLIVTRGRNAQGWQEGAEL